MKQEHWKEQDVIKAVAAGKSWGQKKHSEECVACAAEERWLIDALTSFRETVHSYTAKYPVASFVPSSQRLQTGMWAARIAGAVLALLLLFALPAYRTRQQHARELREQQDAQLLQQIDDQVSSTVPQALEPLMNLASTSSASGQIKSNPTQESQ
ncbi:MAG: hypothetical protein NVS9B15_02010 [Acidobacteriaceae bacterium]